MLIAVKNIKHNGQEYVVNTEVPQEVFTAAELKVLVDDGALKHFTSLSEKKRLDTQENDVEVKVETPAEEAAVEKANAEVEHPTTNWGKQRLLDFASASGVTVDATQTKPEIFAALVAAGKATPDVAPVVEPQVPVVPAQSENPVEPAVPATPADHTPVVS